MMTRARRRSAAAPIELVEVSDSDKDSIDEHIAKRQAHLQKQAQGSDSESEQEIVGFGGGNGLDVCGIDLSSSENEEDDNSDDENEPLKKPSAAYLSDDSEDVGEDEPDSEDNEDWGGRRGKYYGVDTQEFEIMEDDERTAALEEEEEEALRLQRRALASLDTADYIPEDESDDASSVSPVEGEADGTDQDVARDAATTTLYESTPEVAALANECSKYYDLANMWKLRLQWGDVAKARFHLYSAYVTNIAFYFTLRTDPETKGFDLRTHPVVKKILELRELISIHETIEIAERRAAPVILDKAHTDCIKAIEARLENAARFSQIASREEIPNAGVAEGKKAKAKEKRKKRKIETTHKQVALDELDDGNFVDRVLRNKERHTSEEERNAVRNARVPQENVSDDNVEEELNGLDDGSFVARVLQKKENRRSKKKESASPHHYSFKDEVNSGARRRASTQVVLNRGLSRYRPKEKKTPRTKNKLAYESAVKRRKGMVRDAVAVKPGLSYTGEASGINVSSRRGAKLSDV